MELTHIPSPLVRFVQFYYDDILFCNLFSLLVRDDRCPLVRPGPNCQPTACPSRCPNGQVCCQTGCGTACFSVPGDSSFLPVYNQ